MSSRSENMRAIEDEIARLRAQRDLLNGKIDGFESALRMMKGQTATSAVEDLRVPPKERQRRGNVKKTVLDMVSGSLDLGITVNECIEAAEANSGIKLDRASVSSLLSRLKRDEVLFYDGERYRLKKYAGPRQAA